MYLLDTHVLLWWFSDPSLLASAAECIIREGSSPVFVSSVTTWEIAVKKSLGKLEAPGRLFDLIVEEHFTELPISIAHTRALAKLPRLHQDPFDRLLIAQALVEHCAIITRDANIKRYAVPVIGA